MSFLGINSDGVFLPGSPLPNQKPRRATKSNRWTSNQNTVHSFHKFHRLNLCLDEIDSVLTAVNIMSATKKLKTENGHIDNGGLWELDEETLNSGAVG